MKENQWKEVKKLKVLFFVIFTMIKKEKIKIVVKKVGLMKRKKISKN